MATTADYGLGEFAFPRGWFMVARSKNVNSAPAPLRAFGRDLVIYRGESGRVVVLSAYCPHMRAHLAAEQTSSSGTRRVRRRGSCKFLRTVPFNTLAHGIGSSTIRERRRASSNRKCRAYGARGACPAARTRRAVPPH